MAIKKTIDGFVNKEIIINHLSEIVDNSVTSWDTILNLPDIKNLGPAVDLFIDTISKGKKIKFVHDSDVDGIGTYMITYGLLEHYTINNIEIVITDRKKGYGFMPDYLEGMTSGDLIITADNGITSHDGCNFAKERNINVIITDHHQVDEHKGIPNANFIVDPHQEDDNFQYPDINGTFVYWYFIKDFVKKNNINLDMVEYFWPELMLTTISDVMPLNGINRFVVSNGLKRIKQLKKFNTQSIKPWLNTFLNNDKSFEITSDTFGFGLIPALNASGRMTKAEETAYFMSEKDPFNSLKWYEYLNKINEDRKNKQFNLKRFIDQYYGQWMSGSFIIIPGNSDLFEKGVLGPTAGNLAERFNKPTLVLKEKNGIYSGSGRSVGDVNILGLLKNNPYVIQDKTGGHKAACATQIKVEKLNDFYKFMQEETNKLDKKLFRNNSHVLGKIKLDDINWDLYSSIQQFEPFGQKFKRPQFLIKAKVKSCSTSKDGKHLFLTLDDQLGTTIKGMWFNFSNKVKTGSVQTFCCTIQHDDFRNPEQKNIVLYIQSIADFIDWEA